MPDRVIRDELLDSDRWLGLGHDTERLAFVCLLLRCDDFGNLEGGQQRVFRFLSSVTQVKSQENVAAVMMHLADADLVRMYQVDGREFIHIPRLRPHRQYLVRKCPPSPWCDQNSPLGKQQRVINRGLAKNVVTTSLRHSNDVAQGVGVGVGVGVKAFSRDTAASTREAAVANSDAKAQTTPRKRGTKLPVDWTLPDELRAWTKAQRNNWSETRITAIADAFRDHWLGNGTERADWEATWRNWVRRERDTTTTPAPTKPISIAAKRAAVAREIWKHNHDPNDDIIGTATRE